MIGLCSDAACLLRFPLANEIMQMDAGILFSSAI
jgi:hypothetical protein